MPWTVKLSEEAARTIAALDKPQRDRLRKFLREDLATLENPRSKGKPLQGDKRGLWRYSDGRLPPHLRDLRRRVGGTRA